MAVIAALTTSKRFPGYRASSRQASCRAGPNSSSGSPIAADSPSTNTRIVPGGFSRPITAPGGVRAMRGAKNR